MKQIIKKLQNKLKHPAAFYLTGAVLLLLVLGSGFGFFSLSYRHQLPAKGDLAEDQLFSSEPSQAHKNLDLSIAKKDSYGSQPIKRVNDIGVVNDVAESVISFKVSPDNLTEYGLMTTPTSPQPAPGYPVIILCHGYIHPKRYSTTRAYLGDMQAYSKAGFVVIKPDFRGQGFSAKAGRPEGAYYSMAYNTDLLSLISAVKKTGSLDARNLNLWGHSMGAYLALRAAVLSPDIKNLVLLSGPVGYFDDMYKSFIPSSDRNNPTAFSIRQAVLLRYGSPLNNPAFWRKVSPYSQMPELSARTQIYVGSKDSVVPAKFSAELNNQLNNLKKPHDYLVFKGAGHGLLDERPAIYARSIKLMRPSAP